MTLAGLRKADALVDAMPNPSEGRVVCARGEGEPLGQASRRLKIPRINELTHALFATADVMRPGGEVQQAAAPRLPQKGSKKIGPNWRPPN